MKLADVSNDPTAAPIDPFKVEHTPQKYKFDIAPHVHKITHWKPKFDDTVEDVNIELKGNHRTLKWSELEKLFRCDKDERVLDKIVKQAMQYELGVANSEKKLTELHQNQNSPRARAHRAMRVQIDESPKETRRVSVPRQMGALDVNAMSTTYARTSPGN